MSLMLQVKPKIVSKVKNQVELWLTILAMLQYSPLLMHLFLNDYSSSMPSMRTCYPARTCKNAKRVWTLMHTKISTPFLRRKGIETACYTTMYPTVYCSHRCTVQTGLAFLERLWLLFKKHVFFFQYPAFLGWCFKRQREKNSTNVALRDFENAITILRAGGKDDSWALKVLKIASLNGLKWWNLK